MSEHGEPWLQIQDHVVVDDRSNIVLVCDEDWLFMKHMRRVVACVNACQGIPTETLEAIETIHGGGKTELSVAWDFWNEPGDSR